MAERHQLRKPGSAPPLRSLPADRATEPLYTISVVSRLADLPLRVIRSLERAGLVKPKRSAGRQRLYSQQDLDRLRRLKTLISDMGVNMAGAEVALRLMDRIAELEERLLHAATTPLRPE